MIEEFSRVISEEMDFEHEADNIERFQELFRDSPFVIIPRLFREVTTTHVLVIKFYDGFRITDSEAILRNKIDIQQDDPKPDGALWRSAPGQRLLPCRSASRQHPGATGRTHTVLLDYGMVIEIAPDFRKDLIRVVMSVLRQDMDTLIGLLYRLDLIEPDVSPATVKEAATAILSITYDETRSARSIQEITNQILSTFYIAFPCICRPAPCTS